MQEIGFLLLQSWTEARVLHRARERSIKSRLHLCGAEAWLAVLAPSVRRTR